MTIEERLIKAPPRDQNRRTPRWLFELLEREVLGRQRFLLDAAASAENALCKRYFDEQTDGLTKRWATRTFYNPGFARFGSWIKYAFEQAETHGLTAVGVGPTGCSQRWFHAYARCGTIFTPDERVAFDDSTTGEPTRGADRDTMVYVFGPGFWNANEARQFLVRPLLVRSAHAAWRQKHG